MNTLGILRPADGLAQFSLTRRAPAPELAEVIDQFWIVAWDRTGLSPFVQETLPHPCVQLATSPDGLLVHGIASARFRAQLEGRGRVLGVKFRPAGFAVCTRVPVSALVDRVVPAIDALRPELALAAVPADDAGVDAQIAALEAMLRPCVARVCDDLQLANTLVARVQRDRTLARAETLARVAGLSVRSLNRLFERYVGVGPKWVVRRSRVQEAADRVADGAEVDWSALAYDLGYHDQAHLIRDFRAQIGFTPARYAGHCRRGASMRGTTRS